MPVHYNTSLEAPAAEVTNGTANSARLDLSEVARAIDILVDPDAFAMIQEFPSKISRIVPGNDRDRIVAAIGDLSTNATTGIFISLNQVKDGVNACVKTDDIARRRWVLVDIDRDKTVDGKNCATDAEKEQVGQLADQVKGYLSERGWPAPVTFDSGNGVHLLWRIDMPNDENSNRLIKNFLEALWRRFGDQVDKAVHDARRIIRIPGTLNAKGTSTTDRPHRLARIIDESQAARQTIISPEQLRGFIDSEPAAPQVDRNVSAIEKQAIAGRCDLPGDDFNARASWAEILEPHDWRIFQAMREKTEWTRPGKDDGVSATTGFCHGPSGGDLLYVFSSNAAPFEVGKSYDKFAACTWLNHGGDFSKAAAALAAAGYGKPRVESNGDAEAGDDRRKADLDSGNTRHVIMDVKSGGEFVNGMNADIFFKEATDVLVATRKLLCWEDAIYYEDKQPGRQQLLMLATRQKAEPGAASHLANLVSVRAGNTESIMPTKLANAVLASDQLWQRLPRFLHYAQRPIFDKEFTLCGPGWHLEREILVHGPEITPVLAAEPGDGESTAARGLDPLAYKETALDRFPKLKRLLDEFCFRAAADSTNAIAMLLTGVLMNHFIDDPHPGFVIDGNQPGLGKTLLVQCVGRILDDVEPPRIRRVSEEELQKQLGAQIRDSRSRIFFLDNNRDRVESAVLEQNMLSPVLSFRILGQSQNVTRQNAYLWVLTSNLTSATTDFLRRNIPIRMVHEGDPKKRKFDGEPLHFAQNHRLEILAELFGMVEGWKAAGKPMGDPKHRCTYWAKVVGGILRANCFTQFLANLDEAEAAMDDGLQELAALAELIIGRGKTDFFVKAGADPKVNGQTAKEWVQIFTTAQVGDEDLRNCTSERGRETKVGQFLSAKVNRTVDIVVGETVQKATLLTKQGRGRVKHYWFEVDAGSQVGPSGNPAPDSAQGGLGDTLPPWAAPVKATEPDLDDQTAIAEPSTPQLDDPWEAKGRPDHASTLVQSHAWSAPAGTLELAGNSLAW